MPTPHPFHFVFPLEVAPTLFVVLEDEPEAHRC